MIRVNDMSVYASGLPAEVRGERELTAAALRKAYIRGAYDEMRRQTEERDGSFKLAAAAMGFGFLCWATMMYFLFK